MRGIDHPVIVLPDGHVLVEHNQRVLIGRVEVEAGGLVTAFRPTGGPFPCTFENVFDAIEGLVIDRRQVLLPL